MDNRGNNLNTNASEFINNDENNVATTQASENNVLNNMINDMNKKFFVMSKSYENLRNRMPHATTNKS